jgi:hypothetical protein
MARRGALLVGCAATVGCALLLLGCGRHAPAPAAEPVLPVGTPISKTSTSGPVRATVTVTPEKPRLGSPMHLALRVEAEPGVTLELPPFSEALGRFAITSYTPHSERTAAGGTVETRDYVLEAPMSGRQRIPPLRIGFIDERPGQTAAAGADADAGAGTAAGAAGELDSRELLTDEIPLEVASLGAGDTRELLPPRGRLPETARARGALRWPLLAAAGVLLLGLALMLWLWLRRRGRGRVRADSYELALAALAALEAGGMPAGADADRWYVALSGIVRRYLEDRFAIRAPELTTEEFLRDATRSPEVTPAQRAVLGEFLERCDRVKFARYQPDATESRQALDAARRFLDETRPRPAPEATAKPAVAT